MPGESVSTVRPECNKTSVVPTRGAKQLPSNFFINRLLDEALLRRKVDGEEEAKCDHCVRARILWKSCV